MVSFLLLATFLATGLRGQSPEPDEIILESVILPPPPLPPRPSGSSQPPEEEAAAAPRDVVTSSAERGTRDENFPDCINIATFNSCMDIAKTRGDSKCEPKIRNQEEYIPCACEIAKEELLCYNQCPDDSLARAAREGHRTKVDTLCREAQRIEDANGDETDGEDDSDEDGDVSEEADGNGEYPGNEPDEDGEADATSLPEEDENAGTRASAGRLLLLLLVAGPWLV